MRHETIILRKPKYKWRLIKLLNRAGGKIENKHDSSTHFTLLYRSRYANAVRKVLTDYVRFIDHIITDECCTDPDIKKRGTPLRSYLHENLTKKSSYTAIDMKSYYNLPAPNSVAPKIGIISLGGTYLTADIKKYYNTVCGYSGTPNVSYVQVDKVKVTPNAKIRSGDGSDENTLDIEIILGICPNAIVTVYFAPNSMQGFYDAIAKAISNGNRFISISWGLSESYVNTTTLNAFNNLFASAVRSGITISVASGDNGSNDTGDSVTLSVDFPASCPNAIACGGTSLVSLPTEKAWNDGGGGVSAFFRSLYQSPSPVKYQTGTPSNLLGGRSVPDIALNADPYSGWTVVFQGQSYIFGGTSCVAPAFTGFLGLVNANLKTGVSISNILYNSTVISSQAYNDITQGSNGTDVNAPALYSCQVGFDQCTGLGVINGIALATQINALNH